MSVEAIEGCLASPKTALRGEHREVMVKAPLPLLFPDPEQTTVLTVNRFSILLLAMALT